MNKSIKENENTVNKNQIKHERFVKIAERRTQNVISDLISLSNCSNTYNYSYSEAEINKMFSAIDSAIKECKQKFTSNANKNSVFKF